MITKLTEPYILGGEIQIPTKKDSLVLKWLQRWQKLTSFVGIFQFPTEEDSLVLKWLQNDRALHSLWGHSNSNWPNLTSFVGTFRFQLEKRKHFSIENLSNMTEPYIRSSLATFKFQLENAVRYRNDFEDHRTLHPLWGHSNPSWKRRFNIEMIKNSNSNWKIQILTEKDSSLQRWQNLTYFVGAFKFQLKKTVQHWNDFKHERTLHSLWGHSNSNWQNLTSFVVTFRFQLEKTVQYPNDFKNDRTLHLLFGPSKSNWKRQFSIEIFSKITELCILCGSIQIPTEKDGLVLK